MVTIQQTVDVPANGQIHLDFSLPETVSGGTVKIRLTVKPEGYSRGKTPGIIGWIFHPILSYHEWNHQKVMAAVRGLQSIHVFDDVDGVEYQRELRNEWPD
ncbi:MAG: hypothetical protein LBQ61_00420 [Spirochaetales bacterium]|jgi:hypothetical protein|nr:hypothetical protein [Spirochaetales bacterium]